MIKKIRLHILQLLTAPQNKKIFIPAVAVFVVAGFLLAAHPTNAAEWYDIFIHPLDTAAEIISNVLLWIASLLGNLLVVIIDILIGITQYNEFATSPAVTRGWTVVRDVSNMFFVLVLLVIAFGTILKIESYKYGNLLPKLVIAAVLINFSKLIAGFFIDIGQVIMLTFVHAFADTAAANFTSVLRLKNLLDILPVSGAQVSGGTPPSNAELVGVPFLAVVMLIVAVLTMLAMVVVFLVRIIALWILVVLSPLAYILSVLPGGAAKYSSQWWSTFGKWVTTGPILAFFIWLSLAVLTTGGDLLSSVDPAANSQIIGGTGAATGTITATLSDASSSKNIMGFMLAIAMMVISLSIASSLGGAAGAVAGNVAGKIKNMGSASLKVAGAPLALAGKGVSALAGSQGRRARRWYEDKTPAIMQPWNIVKGAKERGKELEQMTREPAVAKGREFWERLSTGGKVKLPHVDKAEAAIESNFAKDYAGMTKEEHAETARNLYQGLQEKPGDSELNRRMRALLRTTAHGGYFDDIMESDYFQNEATWKDTQGQEHTGFKNAEGYYGRSKLNLFLRNSLGGEDGNDQQGLRLVYDLEDIGKKAKHEEYGGHSIYDDKEGKHIWLDPDDTSKALSEYKKGTGRAQLGSSPHTFVNLRKVRKFLHNPDGSFQRGANDNYILDPSGKVRMTGGVMEKFNEETFLATFRSQPAGKITEHSQVRTAGTLLGGDETNIDDKTGAMIGDAMDKERYQHIIDEWYQAPAAFWKKIGGSGLLKFQEVDFETGQKKGGPQNIFDLIIEQAQKNAQAKGKTIDVDKNTGKVSGNDPDLVNTLVGKLREVGQFYHDGKELGKLPSQKEQEIAEMYATKVAPGQGPGGGTTPPPPSGGGTTPPPPSGGGTTPPPEDENRYEGKTVNVPRSDGSVTAGGKVGYTTKHPQTGETLNHVAWQDDQGRTVTKLVSNADLDSVNEPPRSSRKMSDSGSGGGYNNKSTTEKTVESADDALRSGAVQDHVENIGTMDDTLSKKLDEAVESVTGTVVAFDKIAGEMSSSLGNLIDSVNEQANNLTNKEDKKTTGELAQVLRDMQAQASNGANNSFGYNATDQQTMLWRMRQLIEVMKKSNQRSAADVLTDARGAVSARLPENYQKERSKTIRQSRRAPRASRDRGQPDQQPSDNDESSEGQK